MYLIFSFIIFILFLFLNNILKKNKEFFKSVDDYNHNKDICNIFGYKYNSDKLKFIDEEKPYQSTGHCAQENERCLVDTKGNNTCCYDLNCVRLKNNYGYKVCSYKKDACGYFKNDYLKYIFDDDLWESIYDRVKEIFETNYYEIFVEEEDGENIIQNKRKEILNFIKVRGLCGEKYTTQDIRKKLDEFFTKDQVFSGLIYGTKEVAQKEEKDKNERDCRYSNRTIDNY